ncbi:MAG: hypothetical protein DRJ03_06920 [Chloroflexi bacterium]|nr:MAG: hypothetical protein DRJ03_06920 [Chloroflexota bacterium]
MALVLDMTTKSIQVVLGAAVTTNELDCVAHYADEDGASFTEGNNALNTNGTTAVTLVAAPAAATRRLISDYSVFNADTAVATVTVQMVVGASVFILRKKSLQPGDTLRIDGVELGSSVASRAGRMQFGITTAQAHTATAIIQVDWDNEHHKDTAFYTHSTVVNPEQITFRVAGWYNISFQLGWESAYANRLAYRGYISNGGADVSPSDGYDYSRHNVYARFATANSEVDIQVAANDIITIRSQIIDNGGGAWGDMQNTSMVLAATWVRAQYLGG